MKKQSIHWQEAIFWLSLGFLTILVVTWSDGVRSLAHLWAGTSKPQATINDLMIKSSIFFMLWMLAAYKVYRIIGRLTYIERFLHFCAWCRRIEADGQWLPMEAILLNRKEKEISHSICPDCVQTMKKQLKEMCSSAGAVPGGLPRKDCEPSPQELLRANMKSQDCSHNAFPKTARSLPPAREQ